MNNTALTILFMFGDHYQEEELYEFLDIMLERGLDLNQQVTQNNEKISALEAIFELEGDRRVNQYLFDNNIGDFSQGKIPYRILTDKYYSIEAKKKIIDTNINYQYLEDIEEKTGKSKSLINIMDIIIRYESSNEEKKELINYIIDNYPHLKIIKI